MILICGIQNSGKTTYSRHYENVLHVDELMSKRHVSVIDTICERIKESNGDICVEGVFLDKNSRKRLAESYDTQEKTCIWLDVPLDECKRRENRNRATCLIDNCSKLFQPPDYDEGWNEIIILKGGENGYKKDTISPDA